MTPEIMVLIAELAEILGATPINQFEGCWSHDLGDGWHLDANGHGRNIETERGPVPAYHALVSRNGWPVVLVTPHGGAVLGEGGEDAAIEAIREELQRRKAT